MDSERMPVSTVEVDCVRPSGISWPDHEQNLRTRVIEHCRWISTFDRDEAIRIFYWYDELMPWLELRKK